MEKFKTTHAPLENSELFLVYDSAQ